METVILNTQDSKTWGAFTPALFGQEFWTSPFSLSQNLGWKSSRTMVRTKLNQL